MQNFEKYTTAMNITGDARLKALMLHLAGEQVHDIYDTMAAATDKYAHTKQKLTGYFSPKKNMQYQVYIFRKAVQQPGEDLDRYHTRLRLLAKNCEFTDIDSEIKAQLIHAACHPDRKALKEPDMTLNRLLDHGRTLELSEIQATGMEQDAATTVNTVHQRAQTGGLETNT